MRFTLTFTLSKFFLFAFLLSLSFNSLAQTGPTVSGTILDSVDSTSLPGASVFFENTSYGTMADENGKYEISKFPAGTYNIIFMSYGYMTDTLKNITIGAGSHLNFDRLMLPDIYEMDVVEIIGERNMGSDVSVMEEKRNNDQVTEIIGSKEISRTAASNTADAWDYHSGWTFCNCKRLESALQCGDA
jgi:TonB-dependent starch-binding outer membrane protein SusC